MLKMFSFIDCGLRVWISFICGSKINKQNLFCSWVIINVVLVECINFRIFNLWLMFIYNIHILRPPVWMNEFTYFHYYFFIFRIDRNFNHSFKIKFQWFQILTSMKINKKLTNSWHVCMYSKLHGYNTQYTCVKCIKNKHIHTYIK